MVDESILTETQECLSPWEPTDSIAKIETDGTIVIHAYADSLRLNPGQARWLACWILGVTHPIMKEWLRRNRTRRGARV